jgi:hypothetical protein
MAFHHTAGPSRGHGPASPVVTVLNKEFREVRKGFFLLFTFYFSLFTS